jgi:hypothetical protein
VLVNLRHENVYLLKDAGNILFCEGDRPQEFYGKEACLVLNHDKGGRYILRTDGSISKELLESLGESIIKAVPMTERWSRYCDESRWRTEKVVGEECGTFLATIDDVGLVNWMDETSAAGLKKSFDLFKKATALQEMESRAASPLKSSRPITFGTPTRSTYSGSPDNFDDLVGYGDVANGNDSGASGSRSSVEDSSSAEPLRTPKHRTYFQSLPPPRTPARKKFVPNGLTSGEYLSPVDKYLFMKNSTEIGNEVSNAGLGFIGDQLIPPPTTPTKLYENLGAMGSPGISSLWGADSGRKLDAEPPMTPTKRSETPVRKSLGIFSPWRNPRNVDSYGGPSPIGSPDKYDDFGLRNLDLEPPITPNRRSGTSNVRSPGLLSEAWSPGNGSPAELYQRLWPTRDNAEAEPPVTPTRRYETPAVSFNCITIPICHLTNLATASSTFKRRTPRYFRGQR